MQRRGTRRGWLLNGSVRSVVLLLLSVWLTVVTCGLLVAEWNGGETRGVCAFVRGYSYDPLNVSTFSFGVSPCPVEFPEYPRPVQKSR